MRQLAMSAVKHHYWFPSGLIIQVISNRIIRMLLSELCTSPQGCGSAFDFSGSESSYFSQCASGTAYSRFLNADPPASILCKNTPFQFKINADPVLRSRHFFRRLWLRMANVPEPTRAPAPTYLDRLRLQAKKAAPGGSGSATLPVAFAGDTK